MLSPAAKTPRISVDRICRMLGIACMTCSGFDVATNPLDDQTWPGRKKLPRARQDERAHRPTENRARDVADPTAAAGGSQAAARSRIGNRTSASAPPSSASASFIP
jgi:hypothetical protein